MISLSTLSSRLHSPLAASLVADVEVQRWESEGGAILDRRLPPTPAEPDDVASAARHMCETSAFVRAALTVGVTIIVMAVAILIFASMLFDGSRILLAAGAGTMVMTFVALASTGGNGSVVHTFKEAQALGGLP